MADTDEADPLDAGHENESDRRRLYLALVDRRLTQSNRAVLGRVVGIQTAWSVALLAGAAIPVAQALSAPGEWEWVVSILGFVVVVAQGADRLFGRTRKTALAHDFLRRRLGRERRMWDAGEGPYAERDFAAFVERVEGVIEEYDDISHAYVSEMADSAG